MVYAAPSMKPALSGVTYTWYLVHQCRFREAHGRWKLNDLIRRHRTCCDIVMASLRTYTHFHQLLAHVWRFLEQAESTCVYKVLLSAKRKSAHSPGAKTGEQRPGTPHSYLVLVLVCEMPARPEACQRYSVSVLVSELEYGGITFLG